MYLRVRQWGKLPFEVTKNGLNSTVTICPDYRKGGDEMPPKVQIREIDGIKYKLTVKNVKNLHLRVDKYGNISVSANKFCSLRDIDKFVSNNADKIKEYIDKMAVQAERCLFPHVISDGSEFWFLGEKRRISLTEKPDSSLVGDTLYLSKTAEKTPEIAFRKWLSSQAVEIFFKNVDIVYKDFEKYRVPYPRIAIKPLKSQWGNCQPATGKITLNLFLLEAPPECIYYVVVHEFAHFLHPNHSKYFWGVVSQFVPDHKAKRKILREYPTM